MIEINLIPDVKQELIKAQRMRAAVISSAIIASIAALGAVVLVLVYVYGVQFGRHVYLDGQINTKSAELAQVEDLSEMVTIQNQLGKVTELDAKKAISSRMFDVLSAVTPSGQNAVMFSQVDVDVEGGIIRLEGQTKGYDSMEVFRKTVSNAVIEMEVDANVTGEDGEPASNVRSLGYVPLASNINTSDVSYGEDSDGNKVLRFTLSFTYAQELFDPATEDLSLKLRAQGNVTDSYLGIPKSIFTERAKDIEGGN